MICFHFCIFVVLATTRLRWINSLICCDLLSFLYLCRTGNNVLLLPTNRLRVVICFHFCIFVVLATTSKICFNLSMRLWFAFIFVSLSYWQQLAAVVDVVDVRCDLLSFLYLCRTGNNKDAWNFISSCVVICFHFCIFVVLATTLSFTCYASLLLWFAFIFVSLSYWQQRRGQEYFFHSSCDLLSFLYLCRTGNNTATSTNWGATVVICFHFCIFVVLATTITLTYSWSHKLWFAFIFVSLSYWQQRSVNRINFSYRCDLLSFLYLCRTGNNRLQKGYALKWVVICFHFCIFVVLATTGGVSGIPSRKLWFAFIFVSLSYWQQQGTPTHPVPSSCDLLSFLYLCRTGNNVFKHEALAFWVVICFHFCIFVVLATTPWRLCPRLSWLWFAFIFVSLSYWQQLFISIKVLMVSCDLLSFLYLCRTGNNQ